ncbi:MAG: hypothetical protein ACJ8DP_18945, partial [Microvirga sp.]
WRRRLRNRADRGANPDTDRHGERKRADHASLLGQSPGSILKLIPKSGNRFSEKIMLKKEVERDDDSTRSHRALAGRGR